MIRPLRNIHRRTFSGLAVVLPAILLVGLASRQPFPEESLSFLGPEEGGPHLPEALLSGEPLDAPDVLVYWTAGLPSGDHLPAEASLLGPLQGIDPLLPAPSAKGFLLFYSLAHNRIVARTELQPEPKRL
ncbi:MAG: hypothetical protein AB1898_09315 [Acidobacteriota bacterium]